MEKEKLQFDMQEVDNLFRKSLSKGTLSHIGGKMEPSKSFALQQIQQMVVKTIDVEDLAAMADYFQGLTNIITRILKKGSTVIDDEMLTTKEAAKKLRMSTKTLIKHVNNNRIKATVTGKGYIFKLSDVMNF